KLNSQSVIYVELLRLKVPNIQLSRLLLEVLHLVGLLVLWLVRRLRVLLRLLVGLLQVSMVVNFFEKSINSNIKMWMLLLLEIAQILI
uniref:Uncharacterized protein n=1 Tax=Meloidogyne incognita TaxID=6306 RepID=A0A914NW93_MELIC